MNRQVITPARRLRGSLAVPGDKSISHRALIVSAIGEGSCAISGLSSAADVFTTARALTALGARLLESNGQVEARKHSTRRLDTQILVEGQGWGGLMAPVSSIDCQNSGTTARTLLGVLAGRTFEVTLTGDESLRARPMRRVVEPLRLMGAAITGADDGGRLPLTVKGGPLRGIEHRSPIASAQVKTSVLLAGLQAEGETSVFEPGPSRDHTERLLEYLRVPIHMSPDRVVVQSTNIQNARSLSVPGDMSSAAFLLVAAAILPGSEVTVEEVGLNPTRTGILHVLERFGAEVDVEEVREECGEPRGRVTVRAGDRRPVLVEGTEVVRTVDELPLVGVLGALAEGETVIRDAAELRVKESDRVATMAAGLRALGARVETLPDGLVVSGPTRLLGGEVDSAGDHRIAMALAVAALAAEGETAIAGWDAVGVSYPEFGDHLAALVER